MKDSNKVDSHVSQIANTIPSFNTSVQDNNRTTVKLLASISVFFSLCGTIFLILGASLHELYGVASPVFFVAAVVLLAKRRKGKTARSTFYITASIITGSIGIFFLILGLHVHPVLKYGSILLYFCAAFVVYCFVIIIASGEIVRISGIVKVILLLVFAILFARIAVVTLEGFRRKSKEANLVQEQTKLSIQIIQDSQEPVLSEE
ncbi:MAG: hypothetical protein FVQ85_19440 [Planctomycetes bacterium]|nr:hypothetical protein [Planctomycetota bacterium]